MNQTVVKLNTSNINKFKEFERLFKKHNCILEATHIDLSEIEGTLIEVAAHKASQLGENILSEDTSLEVEGANVGINIRWLLDHLSEYAGRKAEWIVLLALRKDDEIHIYKGSVLGTLVLPKGGEGFGFDPVFLPIGADQTLAESKPDHFNARAKAVDAFIKGDADHVHPIIQNWKGPWQKNDNC